jgi:FO synthase subunit 1
LPQGVCEILILSGEVHPRSPRRSDWLNHLYQLGKLALDLGFLPHTNAGPLDYAEMALLKSVNVSMGLMLEQITPKLLETVHRHAPSKEPSLRLAQLEQAGVLGIPFTTGLLLGIGEDPCDRQATLEAIAAVHQRWGHIQEVILQPHSLGQRQIPAPTFALQELPAIVAMARNLLPASITIQIPPNLISDFSILEDCLWAGARDLGGIGPKDEVNPDFPHPHDAKLSRQLAKLGWQLVPRLPVYRAYGPHLAPQLQQSVKFWEGKLLINIKPAKISK